MQQLQQINSDSDFLDFSEFCIEENTYLRIKFQKRNEKN